MSSGYGRARTDAATGVGMRVAEKGNERSRGLLCLSPARH
jgi:hypothetical protein